MFKSDWIFEPLVVRSKAVSVHTSGQLWAGGSQKFCMQDLRTANALDTMRADFGELGGRSGRITVERKEPPIYQDTLRQRIHRGPASYLIT